MSENLKRRGPLVVTMGDPAGIGPEIVVRALLERPDLQEQVVVAGDAAALRRAADGVRQRCGGAQLDVVVSTAWRSGRRLVDKGSGWFKPARRVSWFHGVGSALTRAAAADSIAVAARWGQGFPRFDLIMLGMGKDGHTASLFTFTEALNEREAWVVRNEVPQLNTERLTLTAPVINAARHVMFLVAGEDKAEALERVLEGPQNPVEFPSQMIAPLDGDLWWLVDEAAAGHLSRRPADPPEFEETALTQASNSHRPFCPRTSLVLVKRWRRRGRRAPTESMST